MVSLSYASDLHMLGNVGNQQAVGEAQEYHWCQEEAPKSSHSEDSHLKTTNHQRCVFRTTSTRDRPKASGAPVNASSCIEQANTKEESQAAYSEAYSQAHLAKHDKIKVDLPRR